MKEDKKTKNKTAKKSPSKKTSTKNSSIKNKDIKKKTGLKARLGEIRRSIFGEKKEETSFSLFEVIVIIFISIIFGIIIGYLINFSRGIFKTDSNIDEIVDMYNEIVDEYYDDVNKDDLANAAIKGMVESLGDPYSNYLDGDTAEDFNETIDGSFVGIGVVVMYTGEYNKIIDVYKNEPAYKAGIKVDDILIKVDDQDVRELYGDDLVKLIRGKAGTTVKITVLRREEELEFKIKRGKIDIQNVSNKVIESDDKKIGYIKVDNVAANTYDQFKENLKELEKKKIDSLIIDVRSNPGGHLQQTKDILSLFFDKDTVLYQIQSKKNTQKIYSSSNETRKYPVVVLINKGSASASEILASCFKENYKKATVVGTNSYGKGTVQKSQSLSSGNTVKFTTEKWLTSKGKWLNGKGVEPDVVVEQSEAYYQEPTDENDAQLQEAIKQIKESK